ncbi:MAG: hypothetical protein JXX28_18695 [Deltaproteobacteria bacterium]|nr:hypothetical protein [Deltaproteobacteria bacterium]
MPELPEVEYARQRLTRWTTGSALTGWDLVDPGAFRPKLSAHPTPDPLAVARLQALVGRPSTATARHGKRVGWSFGGPGLLLHLGMTGAWVEGARPRHARLGLRFGDRTLWLNDPRRMGGVSYDDDPSAHVGTGLGPDALLDGSLSQVVPSRSPIKVALMDQRRLAGLGNIHAAEALWRAGISPRLRACDLDEGQRAALTQAIRAQLTEALKALDLETDLRYVSDGGDNPFAVYGRQGQPCPRCGAPISRELLGGRGTWWCPSCQP